jgi:GT2 family glycosyltransferase
MVDTSICMVSLNCWTVLKPCLESLRDSRPGVSYEVIIVDNGSTDGTPEHVERSFPDVQMIRNGYNAGFTKATNQAIVKSSGRYILWLNTDTILKPGSLDKLHQFMEQRPQVGIAGPKVLNPDGTFQPQCKRGLPTPLASLSYMLGLHKIWPNNPRLGQYLLTHLPVDQASKVDAVSGCCLMARRAVWEQIGPLDEQIFAFGEDLDWCVRAKQAGWEVWYYPASAIVHLKGQGGVHSKPYHKAWGMHHGMWIFYRKHLMQQYAWPVTGLVWLGVWGKFILASALIWLRRSVRPQLRRTSA